MREPWVEVSKDDFYGYICGLRINVHPRIVGSFPYTSEFRVVGGISEPIVGKQVDYYPEGSRLVRTKYYLPADVAQDCRTPQNKD